RPMPSGQIFWRCCVDELRMASNDPVVSCLRPSLRGRRTTLRSHLFYQRARPEYPLPLSTTTATVSLAGAGQCALRSRYAVSDTGLGAGFYGAAHEGGFGVGAVFGGWGGGLPDFRKARQVGWKKMKCEGAGPSAPTTTAVTKGECHE